MTNQTQVAPIALTISNISVRQDAEGRYCLNDLYKASGSNPKHKPSNWLITQKTQDLISKLEIAHIRAIDQKKGVDSFAVKELAISYAMWISASFSLKVIRAYDARQNQPLGNSEQLPKPDPIQSFRIKILTNISGGLTTQQVVPFGCCIIDPNDPVSVATVIREYVPSTPQMLSALSSACITKLMDCQDAAIKRGKQ